MLRDFILNAAILISSFAVFGNLLKDFRLNDKSSMKMKIVWGIIFGSLGSVLMYFSIRIDNHTIADLRHLATVFAAALGGFIPAVISALVTSLARIVIFGVNQASINAAFLMLLIGISCGYVSKVKISFHNKAFLMNIVSLLFIALSLFLNVENKERLPSIYFYHFLISSLGGFLSYQIIIYFIRSNEAFIKLQISEEDTLRTSSRLHALLTHLPYGIFAEDQESRLTIFNKQFIEMFNCSFQLNDLKGTKLEGLPSMGIDCFSDVQAYQLRRLEILKNKEYVLGEEFKLRDGRIIERDAIPIYSHGEFYGYIWQFKDITARKKLEKELKEASIIDGLTGIPNRRYFDETILRDWNLCSRNSRYLSLIMFDIDFFKNYNDSYGHLSGDECLKMIAQTVRHSLKRSSDVVCRYGGEEFAVILSETNMEGARIVANQIQDEIRALAIPHCSSSVSSIVSTSIGIATVIPRSQSDPTELISKADKALYIAKEAGRNSIKHYEKEMQTI